MGAGTSKKKDAAPKDERQDRSSKAQEKTGGAIPSSANQEPIVRQPVPKVSAPAQEDPVNIPSRDAPKEGDRKEGPKDVLSSASVSHPEVVKPLVSDVSRNTVAVSDSHAPVKSTRKSDDHGYEDAWSKFFEVKGIISFFSSFTSSPVLLLMSDVLCCSFLPFCSPFPC